MKQKEPLKCPFCGEPLSGEHARDCPSMKEVGETVSFDDIVEFQQWEATPVDMESQTMLERLIGRGEIPRKESKAMVYAAAIVFAMIGLAVVLYMLKSFGILP